MTIYDNIPAWNIGGNPETVPLKYYVPKFTYEYYLRILPEVTEAKLTSSSTLLFNDRIWTLQKQAPRIETDIKSRLASGD